MDVLDLGRMGFFMDPTGAAFGIWQPKEHTGAEVVNRAGSFGWNELQTRDAEKAKEFYAAVFGWEPVDTDMGGGSNYIRWQLGDRIVAGMIQMDENFPPEMPSNWLVYFGVEDADEAVAKAQAAGGSVHVEPTDIPGMGRFAVLADPHGAVVRDHRPRARGARARRAAGGGDRRVSGDLVYFQINVADGEKAKAFYGGLFGWEVAARQRAGRLQVRGPVAARAAASPAARPTRGRSSTSAWTTWSTGSRG